MVIDVAAPVKVRIDSVAAGALVFPDKKKLICWENTPNVGTFKLPAGRYEFWPLGGQCDLCGCSE